VTARIFHTRPPGNLSRQDDCAASAALAAPLSAVAELTSKGYAEPVKLKFNTENLEVSDLAR